MPEVIRATVGAAGEELEDWLELAPLDPIYRLTFHDGARLDIVPGAERMAAEVERLAGPEEAARYLAFRAHLGRMLEAEWGPFINRNIDSPRPTWRGPWPWPGWPAWAASGGSTTWSPPT